MSSASSTPSEWELIRVRLARKFFLSSIAQLAVAISIGFGLASLVGRPEPSTSLRLPAAFQFATLLLAAGSWLLQRAGQLVRQERQEELRQTLSLALATAVLFVGVQSFGLWQFVQSVSDYRQTQVNVHGFVFMFTAIHALHFIIAQSVLLWVTLSAFAGRYDHEYYWGLTFASCCWHILGIVWIAILCVFAIAR